MKGILSKISILFFFLISFFFILSPFAFAQTHSANLSQTVSPQVNPYISPNTNPDVPNNLHNWTQSAMIEVMSALFCQLTGVDPTNPNQQCLGVDQKTGKIGFVPNGGGAIGVMNKLIAMTFTMPIHTGDYVNYLSQNFGITKNAYAQGVGFRQLTPFINIWVVFRNLVYLLFIIVFVVIGMFIMLRVQFDPRTVMTVQNQIPKLIIGIILVTFSFAIAGLMIDAMYIVIYFVYSVAVTIPGSHLNQLIPSTLQRTDVIGAFGVYNIVGVANTIATGFVGSIWGMLGLTTDFQPLAIGGGISGGLGVITFALLAWNPLGLLAALGPLAFTTAIPWIIAFLIIFIAIFTALFKLWFELIKAYTFILFDIVLAPFWIISSLTPGNPAGFSLWIRAVLSNLSVFPTTIVMFLLGKLFIDAFDTSPDVFFIPPLIGSAANPKLISAIVGITVILTTPAVVGMVKNAFKAPNFPLTTAGAMFGAGAAVPGRTVEGVSGLAFGTAYKPEGFLSPEGSPSAVGRFLRSFGFIK
ncbi:MAG: hypothetical protein Q7R31_01090 [Candidatus Levybacteria bacterium]|nr:hypothetical protein [Candidatus Levybacteria bacterium]